MLKQPYNLSRCEVAALSRLAGVETPVVTTANIIPSLTALYELAIERNLGQLINDVAAGLLDDFHKRFSSDYDPAAHTLVLVVQESLGLEMEARPTIRSERRAHKAAETAADSSQKWGRYRKAKAVKQPRVATLDLFA